MAQVTWSVTALQHLRDILAYIAADSPNSAREFDRQLRRAVERLSLFPESGRRVPRAKSERAREIVFKNYRIGYVAYPDEVIIVAVWHGAMDVDSRSGRIKWEW